jgi:hypothetical protein
VTGNLAVAVVTVDPQQSCRQGCGREYTGIKVAPQRHSHRRSDNRWRPPDDSSRIRTDDGVDTGGP